MDNLLFSICKFVPHLELFPQSTDLTLFLIYQGSITRMSDTALILKSIVFPNNPSRLAMRYYSKLITTAFNLVIASME